MFRVLIIFFITYFVTDAYKILVYNPKFGHSHSNFMGRIADILVEAGHDVSSIVSVIDPNVADGTKLSKIIRIPVSQETSYKWMKMFEQKTDAFQANRFNPFDAYFMGKSFSAALASQCRAVLEEPGLLEKLKKYEYDVLFTEHFDMCGVGLAEVIKPRSLISIAAANAAGPQADEFGIPPALSFSPASTMNVHSMWDRIVNLYEDFLSRLLFDHMRTSIHALYIEKFGLNFPTLEQISSNSAYVFTNMEPLIDYAVPTITKVIPIGGIGAKDPKKLSEVWEKVLSKRRKTILLSFGTILQSAFLPINVKNSIVETAKSLPDITFIWKYEKEDNFTQDITSKVSNIELVKWMPQVDLLGHPNLCAFITHGGMGSTQEVALSGVPGIFIPIFGDQPRNAGMMEYHGLGKVLDKSELSDPAKFVEVIMEVLENKSYLENARRVSAMLRKRPFSAREQLIKYTEFAAEFGPSKALRPQSHDMNWIEYHNVDIVIVGIVISFILLVASLGTAKYAISRIVFDSKTKKD